MTLSLDFAFEGFRLIRERPKLIALWGSVTLLGSVVGTMVLVAFAGQFIAAIYAVLGAVSRGNPAPDLTIMNAAADRAMPGLAMYMMVSLLTSAVVTTAVCRAVLGKGDDRLGFLKFGMDEVRMLVVNVAMTLMSAVIFVTGGVLGAVGGPAGQVLGTIVAIGAIVWLRIRLSLNCAQTFDTGRLDLLGSFIMTREVSWPLTGGYAMALGLAVVVWYLCLQVVNTCLILAFNPSGMPDMTSLHAFLTAPNVVSIVLTGGVIEPLIAAIVYGAPAAAYMRLRGKSAFAKADVV